MTPPITILTYGLTPDTDEAEGKFLQLVWHGREYLVFAPRERHRFHNEILAQFLREHAIAHRWLDDATLKLDSDELNVIGGGRFRLDRRARELLLRDNSQVYGRFDERDLPQKLADASSLWQGFSITIAP